MIKSDANNASMQEQLKDTGWIDLKQLLPALLRKSWIAALGGLICALPMLLCVAPRYSGTVVFYAGNASLVDTYMVLLDTEKVLTDIAAEAGVHDSPRRLRSVICPERVAAAELFRVTVTDTDPARTEALTDAVATVLPGEIAGIVDMLEAKVVDTENSTRFGSWSGRALNGVAGFCVGFCVCAGFLLLRELGDASVRSTQEISRLCAYPVLASGEDADANTRLRTRLSHLLGAAPGRMIGICGVCESHRESSSQLALSLSRQGRRVLLVDCDLRRFTESARPGGLSGFLAGIAGTEGMIRCCGIPGHEKAFHVLHAGKNPVNPAELLESGRMKRLLRKLRKVYDDVILSLPAIQEAADALVIAPSTDGMLLTVALGRCSGAALAEAIDQLEAVNAPILGILALSPQKC